MIDDGRSLLHEVLKLMRPDVQMNAYAELAKIKSIKPIDYAFNIVKWHSAMESKRISIENKVPGVYHDTNTSWIISTHLSLLKSRVLTLKSTFFAIDTFMETPKGGMHCISLAK
jgi:hypothetical protein